MVLNIIAEPGLKHQIDEIRRKKFPTGFIFGNRHSPSSKSETDYVAFFAQTPEKEDQTPQDDSVDVAWIIEHAKQALPMLPGGVAIRGIFLNSQETGIVEARLQENVIKNKLFKIFKSVLNFYEDDEDTFLIFLIGRNSLSAKSINISQDSATVAVYKPVDLKFEPFRWLKLRGSFILDFASLISESKSLSEKSTNFTLQVEEILRSLKRLLKNERIILFDHSLRPPDESLDPLVVVNEPKSQRNKHKKNDKNNDDDDDDEDEEEEEDEKRKEFEFQILLTNDSLMESGSNEGTTVVSTCSNLKLGGKIAVRCFLHPKATIKEATEAVIQDIVISLGARFQIHADSLEVDDKYSTNEVEGIILHEPPRRIMVPVPSSSSLHISDYLHSGETCYDSMVSIQELFGFAPNPDNMDDEIELIASQAEIKATEDEDDENAENNTRTSTPVTRVRSPTSLVLTFVVAGLGILLYYFFSVSDRKV